MPKPFRRAAALSLSAALVTGLLTIASTSATAAPGHDKIVSAVPPAWTPAVNDGSVQGTAQTGSTMVAVGDFTSVTPSGGATVTRNGLFAFNATTGALVSSFNPAVNGAVNDVYPGPTAGTVYIAGGFTTVNGATARRVALVNATTGALVPGFSAPVTNGVVNTLVKNGNRLYVGGNFTTAGGVAHSGFMALNASTGALDPFVGNQVAQRHNDTGSGAQGPIGVRDLDVTPDGSRLVAIGNFKTVDGLPRDQLVVLDLTGSTSVVQANWRTRRYEPYCFNWAFDTYMRGVAVSPDGSYFAVATTGGPSAGTLCDAAARFEFSSTGDAIEPTWADHSGGDTLWGITVTEKAVYVGGHQRWMNNFNGADYAGAGAVPRPGLAALDVNTGLPIKWNPGRNPRGAAVYSLYPTDSGLWMGSDTPYVGNRQYLRPRLAYFPLAGGTPQASDAITGLPGTAYLGGSTAVSRGNILYRVNAGGATVGSVDPGPDWEADDQGSSPYRNDGSNAAGWGSGASTDATVPSSTPNGVFDSERWSPSDNPALKWAFPAPTGAPLQVRLFFANRYTGTSAPGSRVFDVSIDGSKVLDNFDIAATTGDQRGTMKAFNITSDGTVNIDFSHEVENPLINAIEIVRTDQAPPTSGGSSLGTVALSATSAQPVQSVPTQGIDWSTVRGAFMAGGKLWYGTTNGDLRSRPYDAGQFGAETVIDPYNDPTWAGVSTGSGNNFDGSRVALYGQMSSVTAMAYADGRLYYTRSGDANLYWRWFNTDSGIIGAQQFTANGGRSWNGTAGMFVADGSLYFVSSNGNLNKIPLVGGAPSGTSSVVDGPGLSGNDWRARAVFLAPSAPVNQAPTAAFTVSCVDLTCDFDGRSSSDPDGTVSSWAWDFGPGTASGSTTRKTFAAAGTYTVGLTVTDDAGATNATSKQVTVQVTQPSTQIAFVGSSSANANATSVTTSVPATVQAGDTLLLAATLSNQPTATDPAGWTRVDTKDTTGVRSVVWKRTAASGDAGGSVTVALSAVNKSSLVLTAYRGAGGVGTVATTSDANTTTHTTAPATVSAGSWVVWVFGDKGASTSAWTPGAGVTPRGAAYSTGSGRVSTMVADSDGPRSGTVGAVTATTDATSSRSIAWTVVLEPQV